MGSRADKMQFVPVDLVEQKPVRFNVAIAKVLPIASQRVIPIFRRKWIAFNEQSYDGAQLAHFFAAFFHELYFSLESRTA